MRSEWNFISEQYHDSFASLIFVWTTLSVTKYAHSEPGNGKAWLCNKAGTTFDASLFIFVQASLDLVANERSLTPWALVELVLGSSSLSHCHNVICLPREFAYSTTPFDTNKLNVSIPRACLLLLETNLNPPSDLETWTLQQLFHLFRDNSQNIDPAPSWLTIP
jgi:hypothetical protein